MANPLAALAALAGTAGGALTGGFEGQVEGEGLRRKFETQDLQNQLRILELIAGRQALTTPKVSFHGERMFSVSPQGQTTVSQLPPLSETPAERASREYTEAGTALHRKQAEQVGVVKPTQTEEFGQLMRSYTQALSRGDRAGAGAILEQIKGLSQAMHPSAALTPRTTTTKTEKITPRKQVTKEEVLTELNNALPGLVNELSGKPGFNVPGSFVLMPNGQPLRGKGGKPIRKEDVISQAFLDQYGVEVTVRWEKTPKWGDPNAGRFRIVQAWTPEQREPLETTRTTGPAEEQ